MALEYSDLFKEIEGEKDQRNAYGSIEGYLFQFELLLYHILVDGTNEDPFGDTNRSINWEYRVEEIEDYCRVYKNETDIMLQVGQIKYHSGYAGDSAYYEAVLWLYLSYLKVIKSGIVTQYKSRIFHYDTSSQKGNIIDVLNNAILKATDDISKEKKSKLANVLEKINNLPKDFNDSEERRLSFSENSCFYKVQMDREKLIDSIKKLISKMFSAHLPEETIYSGLIIKLIKDGKNKVAITLNDLKTYLSSDQFTHGKVYIDLITEEIYYFCVIKLADIVYDSTMDEKISSIYEDIGKKIFGYLSVKFAYAELRRSFLQTAIYDMQLNEYVSGSAQEWEIFLKCEKQIQDFIIKLANIIYSYETIQRIQPNLDEWFTIEDGVWLFKCPWEERGNGIIIPDCIGANYFTYLSYISKRYEHADIKPNVWYFSKEESGQAILSYGREAYEYRIDITRPNAEKLALDKVDSNFFYLECLHCLKKDCFDDCGDSKKVFEKGCINA